MTSKSLKSYVLFCSMYIIAGQNESARSSYIDAVYYEIMPYIFTNDKGELDGIYPMIISQAARHCLNDSDQKTLVNFVHKFENREEFDLAIQSNDSDIRSNGGGGEGQNFQDAIWFPIMFKGISVNLNQTGVKNTGYRLLNLITVKHLAVIVSRDKISLITKVASGLKSCNLIFFITFQMAVFFGVLLWLLERNSDSSFPKTYIQGISTGLWWSFSLGYNDTVPKTHAGRLVATTWVAMIVLVASIMTASITNSVTGGLNFSIHGRDIAFLENSWELDMVTEDYGVKPVLAKSYGEVIDKLREGKAFAAVIDKNVASWYKDRILNDSRSNPLRIVELLPVKMFVDARIPKNITQRTAEIFECMNKNDHDVYHRSTSMFHRSVPIETLHLDSIEYLVRTNVFVQVILSTVCVFLFIGFILAVYTKNEEIRDNMRETVEVITKRQPQEELERKPTLKRFGLIIRNKESNHVQDDGPQRLEALV